MACVSPSILGVDYLELKNSLSVLEKAGTEFLHLDVMDGIFVPNISFGVPVIKSIKKHTNIPLDIHLMIDRPHRYIEEFAAYADILSFHYEAGSDNAQLLKKIRALGCKSAITVKPKTPIEEIFPLLPLCDMVLIMSVEPGFGGQGFIPEAVDKIAALKHEITKQNLDVLIEVDGGINGETAKQCVDAGVDILVAGSYVFNAENIEAKVKELQSL